MVVGGKGLPFGNPAPCLLLLQHLEWHRPGRTGGNCLPHGPRCRRPRCGGDLEAVRCLLSRYSVRDSAAASGTCRMGGHGCTLRMVLRRQPGTGWTAAPGGGRTRHHPPYQTAGIVRIFPRPWSDIAHRLIDCRRCRPASETLPPTAGGAASVLFSASSPPRANNHNYNHTNLFLHKHSCHLHVW